MLKGFVNLSTSYRVTVPMQQVLVNVVEHEYGTDLPIVCTHNRKGERVSIGFYTGHGEWVETDAEASARLTHRVNEIVECIGLP